MTIFGHTFDIMALILAAALLVVILTSLSLHRNPDNHFDILDLFMENNHLSKAAVVMMGTFGLTTWMMVELTLSGKMTEGYFGLYAAAWITPVVVRLITGTPFTNEVKHDPTIPKINVARPEKESADH